MLAALIAYALTGGADFGGGVWDVLAGGPRKEQQRAHIAASLAPIWEANHVWLIIVVVMLFTGFPAAYSALSVVLHIPLTILLIGIVLRGSAFVFRSYGARTDVQRHRWGATFAAASIVTPIFLGIVIGAVATGAAGRAHVIASTGGPFSAAFVDPWLAPFPLAVGLFALASFAYLAAVYLALNAPTTELQEDFRRRALGAAMVVGVIAFGTLLVAFIQGHTAILQSVLYLPVQLAIAIPSIIAIVALWKRRYGIARVAAAAQVTGILLGWAGAQYPFIVPDLLTIDRAAAPAITLKLLVAGLAVGTAVLLPSLRYLYRVFRKPVAPAE
jgi:cytochrome bd ubiquinol oxidase subunit II